MRSYLINMFLFFFSLKCFLLSKSIRIQNYCCSMMEISSFLKLSRTELFRMIMLCETYSLITARLPMRGIKTKLETDDGKHQKKKKTSKQTSKQNREKPLSKK